MPVVNPGIRRQVAGAITRLFNGAAFALPLTHTAVPTRGSITPTFTRATTETGQRWDEAGYLDFTALAGEIVFKGARREYNQVSTKSADNTVGSTISANVTAATTTLTMTAANGSYWYKNSNGNAAIGRVYQCSADVSSTVDRTLCLRALATSGTNSDVQNVAITSTVQRVKLKFTADFVGVVLFGVENRVAYATDTSTTGVITFTNVQISDITGETNQTTIRPHVSVGVESAPAYHGSMVDGVKCYDTDRSGNPISTSGSYPIVGYVPWEARTNSLLHARDLSNAAWVKVNCTGVKNAVGSDGVTNSASTMTATGANATVLQTIVLAAAARSYSVKLKRKTGTGTVSICRDGVTFTDITSQINSSTYTTVKIENTSVLNPVCGIKLATSGDAVYVDWNQDEAGAFSTPAIDTTTVAVARNADWLTYSGIFSDTAGTFYCEAAFPYSVAGNEILTGTTGLLFQLNAGQLQTYDGTNSAQQAISVSSTKKKMSCGYGSGKSNFLSGVESTGGSAAFDGSMNLANTIGVGCTVGGTLQLNGPVGNIRYWNRQLSDSEQTAITS